MLSFYWEYRVRACKPEGQSILLMRVNKKSSSHGHPFSSALNYQHHPHHLVHAYALLLCIPVVYSQSIEISNAWMSFVFRICRCCFHVFRNWQMQLLRWLFWQVSDMVMTLNVELYWHTPTNFTSVHLHMCAWACACVGTNTQTHTVLQPLTYAHIDTLSRTHTHKLAHMNSHTNPLTYTPTYIQIVKHIHTRENWCLIYKDFNSEWRVELD